MSPPPGPAAIARRLDRGGTPVLYASLLSLAVLCAAGAVGLALREPWLFPSLGPTVMIFFETPTAAAARPRNALIGHGVGLLAGFGCLIAFGLADAPSVPDAGLTLPHLLAGALSVAITTAVLLLLHVPHPPAGATTLIVSLGILREPVQLLSMAGAIVLITVLGAALNRVLLGRRTAQR